MFSKPWQRSNATPSRCCSLSSLRWQPLHVLTLQQRPARLELQHSQIEGGFDGLKYTCVVMLGPGMVWPP